MKSKQINNKVRLPGKSANRSLAANLSPPNILVSKSLKHAATSGIIPGRLHLCRACFRFIPAKQI